MGGASVLKLVANAVYGRLAQERLPDGSRGRWANMALAGMITATVRARVLRMVNAWPGVRVLAIQTDSVTLLGDHRGQSWPGWSCKTGQDALLLPSGVYHVAAGDAVMDRVSGLPLEYLAHVNWAELRQAWQSYGLINAEMVESGLAWHLVKFPFFVGIGQSLLDKQGRYRYWMRSAWDLIGSPGPYVVADRVGETRQYCSVDD